MADRVKPRRAYDASGRRQQARERRRLVLECAQRLFLAGGFAATTMPEVAAAANMSVQNVYKVFGNKVGLAKAVFDFAIAGDDEPIAMTERPTLLRVRQATDPREKLERYGQHLAEVAPRHVPFQLVILDAAANDPEAARLWDQLQAERLHGMAMFAGDLAANGWLRTGVDATEAAEVLWIYNSAELYRLIVLERGWDPERYGRWIAEALTAALLPPLR